MNIAERWAKRVVLCLILVAPATAGAQVTPTSEWVSAWSDATTLNANAVPVGSVIRVFDADGTLCGETTVTTSGSYGLIPIYRDDPTTPAVDEGAEPGDALSFTIDGVAAAVIGPAAAATWTFNGDVMKLDLAAETVMPTSEWINVWSDNSSVDMELVPAGAVIRAYDPQGVLCGSAEVTSPGQFGAMPVYRDDPLTPGFDEGAAPGDTIRFTIDGQMAFTPAGMEVVWTFNGDVQRTTLNSQPTPVSEASWGEVKARYRE